MSKRTKLILRTLLMAAFCTPAVWGVAAWAVGPVRVVQVIAGVATVLVFVTVAQAIDTQLAANYLPIFGLVAGALAGLLAGGVVVSIKTMLGATGILLGGMLVGGFPALLLARSLGLEQE